MRVEHEHDSRPTLHQQERGATKGSVPRARQRIHPHQFEDRAFVTRLLENELARLSSELPATVDPAIRNRDTEFAIQTLTRRGCHQLHAAYQVAAGIAWERIVVERILTLTAQHPQLTLIAERWKPPGVNLDLHAIVHDTKKDVVWILDAKNTKRDDNQLSKMHDQIRLPRRHPELTTGCPTITGLIVHHRAHLTTTPQQTHYPNILRCTLQSVGDLLLANQLPGKQTQAKTRHALPRPCYRKPSQHPMSTS